MAGDAPDTTIPPEADAAVRAAGATAANAGVTTGTAQDGGGVELWKVLVGGAAILAGFAAGDGWLQKAGLTGVGLLIFGALVMGGSDRAPHLPPRGNNSRSV